MLLNILPSTHGQGEQAADLEYDKLLAKANRLETTIVDYHHNKKNREDSAILPSPVTASFGDYTPGRAMDVHPSGPVADVA